MPVANQPRNDVAAHVVIGVVFVGVGTDRVDQHLGGEDVVAHRHERGVRVVGRTRRIDRLLDEAADAAGFVGVDAAERARLGTGHPDPRDRGPGTALDVEPQHLLGVHPVDVVGAENHDVVRILVVDQVERLIDRVRGAGVPPRAEPLLGGDRGDVLTGQTGQSPVLRNVTVQ